ncbi:protein of unknown function [Pseudomonas marincola]|uniref:Uncharacterized protein n=1 Tax=Pseudomonas marincola TaxID=437900 RepID=A0A8S2BCU4_9PSED|nr:protein of unknown function [Pseudomonas marincola]
MHPERSSFSRYLLSIALAFRQTNETTAPTSSVFMRMMLILFEGYLSVINNPDLTRAIRRAAMGVATRQ